MCKQYEILIRELIPPPLKGEKFIDKIFRPPLQDDVVIYTQRMDDLDIAGVIKAVNAKKPDKISKVDDPQEVATA